MNRIKNESNEPRTKWHIYVIEWFIKEVGLNL